MTALAAFPGDRDDDLNHRANTAMQPYVAACEEPASALMSILCDLLHRAEVNGIDYHEADDAAWVHYLDETAQPES